MFYLLMPDAGTRDALIAYLKEHGIVAVFHYVPLHASPVGSKYGYRAGELPVTEDLSGRIVRLPFYHALSPMEQMEVVLRIKDFAARACRRRAAA
jgi:dTDP-4-amino-4,6-dideoxygalactose transaminase